MNGVDPAYTQKTKDAGENVKTHLINGGLSDATFRYQGSVMTNTHIKGYSDIDLLTISEKFYQYDFWDVRSLLNDSIKQRQYDSSQIEKVRYEDQLTKYQGDSLGDLKKLRTDCEEILKSKYSNCDTSKPKSIKIRNLNLNREVDIVIANWYDDIISIVNNKGNNRGIQIYNKDDNSRGKIDFPSISIDRINNKSSTTGGRLKKMIRFLKNLKGKSTLSIELSSFEINAICYDINQATYSTLIFHQLVPVLYQQLTRLSLNQSAAESLVSVDGREYIFLGKPNKLRSLQNLMTEIESILNDLKTYYIL
ncbi:MAG: hypothetical protein EOP34_07975 [Rickettsiales bacterium]|nr:MAG: hypothetical protein EOP34_07975 [Rickettsiales bacterium]